MQAFVFPGQGSQTIGMGKALFDAFIEAKEVFQEVDDALNQKLSTIIFEGPEDELTATQNTQPALMATSVAVQRVLEKQSGKSLNELCNFVAGHSLGEYSALCAAKTFSLADTARLLRIRGDAMQQAVPKGKGAMAAIIGLEFEAVEALVNDIAVQTGGICELANDNSSGQVVISGEADAIAKGEEIAKAHNAKKYVVLNVSAPFHCSLMQPAADAMKQALSEVNAAAPIVPLMANVTAELTTDPEAIKQQLVEQVTGRVRWRESVINLKEQSVTRTVEIGAGKVLSGLSKRIDRSFETANILSPEDIESYIETKLIAA